MSNFMGPMAPPQAAQPQPQALDFKTDPNQRQQFKNFMRQRMQPPMARVPAPAPMPQPIPNVPAGSYIFPEMDIFNPQPYAEGGIVGGLSNLGEMSGQMVEALNQLVYGGGQGGGMGSSGAPAAPAAMSSPIGSGASSSSVVATDAMSGALPPPLPPIQPMAPSQPSSLNPSSVVYSDNMMANQGPIQALTVPQQNLNTSGLNILPVEPEVSNGSIFKNAVQPMNRVGAYGFEDSAMSQPVGQAVPDLASNMSREMSPDSRYFNVPDRGQVQPLPGIQPSAEVQARLDALGLKRGLGQGVNGMGQRPAGIGGIGGMGGLLMRNEGGAVPPRRTDIRGQYHELSYITPDEADILMALGGSGEPGPMGIPQYSYGDGDFGQDDPASDATAGAGPSGGGNDDGEDPGDFTVNTNTPKGSDPDDPFAGEEGDDFRSGIYGNVDFGTTSNIPGTLGESYDMDAINLGRQNRQEILDNIEENEIETGKVSTGTAVNDGNIESLDALTNAVESSSKIGGTETGNNLLGSFVDDMLEAQQNLNLSPYSVPENVGYTEAGLPRGLDFIDTPQGRMTTNLAGTTAAQRADMPDYMNPEDRTGIIAGLMNYSDINPAKSVYGYEIPDLKTGEITGMTGPNNMPGPISSGLNFIQDLFLDPAETTEDLLNRGVYTGYGPGSYINEDQSDGGSNNVLLPLPPEEVVPESTDPNQMGNTVAPTAPTAPGSVLVPSTRTSTPFSGQMPVGYGTPQTGQINPYSLAEMQRYQQMLARLGQPKSPVGFADGGSVLDAAAGKFLESLTAA